MEITCLQAPIKKKNQTNNLVNNLIPKFMMSELDQKMMWFTRLLIHVDTLVSMANVKPLENNLWSSQGLSHEAKYSSAQQCINVCLWTY